MNTCRYVCKLSLAVVWFRCRFTRRMLCTRACIRALRTACVNGNSECYYRECYLPFHTDSLLLTRSGLRAFVRSCAYLRYARSLCIFATLDMGFGDTKSLQMSTIYFSLVLVDLLRKSDRKIINPRIHWLSPEMYAFRVLRTYAFCARLCKRIFVWAL